MNVCWVEIWRWGVANIDIVNILTRRCATIHPFSFNRSVGRANSIVWINQKTLSMLVTMHRGLARSGERKGEKISIPREMHTSCKMIDVFPYIHIYAQARDDSCKNNASMIASYFIFFAVHQETRLLNHRLHPVTVITSGCLIRSKISKCARREMNKVLRFII